MHPIFASGCLHMQAGTPRVWPVSAIHSCIVLAISQKWKNQSQKDVTDTPQMVPTAAVQADGEDGHVSDSAALASYLQQMKLDRAGQKDGSRTGQPSHSVGGPRSPRRHDSESCLLSCTIPHDHR